MYVCDNCGRIISFKVVVGTKVSFKCNCLIINAFFDGRISEQKLKENLAHWVYVNALCDKCNLDCESVCTIRIKPEKWVTFKGGCWIVKITPSGNRTDKLLEELKPCR